MCGSAPASPGRSSSTRRSSCSTSPTSGLDPVRTALLCELIREVHEENGGCYLVISHDLATARRIAEFLAVLWKGKIVESGPADELFNSKNEFIRQFLNADVKGPLAMD